MAEMWKPHAPEVYQSWIKAIVDPSSDELTQWEQDFLVSIFGKLNAGFNLTQTQSEKLEQIYVGKTH